MSQAHVDNIRLHTVFIEIKSITSILIFQTLRCGKEYIHDTIYCIFWD
jgi:hypothetical protein